MSPGTRLHGLGQNWSSNGFRLEIPSWGFVLTGQCHIHCPQLLRALSMAKGQPQESNVPQLLHKPPSSACLLYLVM